jgi:hypothetical protein
MRAVIGFLASISTVMSDAVRAATQIAIPLYYADLIGTVQAARS